jgi:hypothetical protein
MERDLTTPVLVLPEFEFPALLKEQLAKSSMEIRKERKSGLAINFLLDMCRPLVPGLHKIVG